MLLDAKFEVFAALDEPLESGTFELVDSFCEFIFRRNTASV